MPLCRKRKYDKKIKVGHGSSAMNFGKDDICDTWIVAVLSECHNHGTCSLVLQLLALCLLQPRLGGLWGFEL